ncbi:hypothetical protein CTI12_AA258510 [Artemisia annua]|uniref:Reverse transcriptase domain-containing protein n=1 Tax=Artemisia annua TaxID=35608 RepID=A0A2U1NJR1_ARTAN|nr:hypothetical protein CTI12_AA258510 [Artemisia annua]
MAQHKFDNPTKGRIATVKETLNKFIRESSKKHKESEGLIWNIKKGYDHAFKSQATSINKLKVQVRKRAEVVRNRNVRELPGATETNPRDRAHAITTRSGLNYGPPTNPLDNSEIYVQENSARNNGKGDKEVAKESQVQKKVVESYVPPIPFPGRLKKGKEREQFRNFLENL